MNSIKPTTKNEITRKRRPENISDELKVQSVVLHRYRISLTSK